MKRMLINATQEEELRIAMVDGQNLYDLNIESSSSERKKANIYKGTISRIEPSLEAAFINYGEERHGFLPLKEISREYFIKEIEPGSKVNIKDVLKEGQDIVVQIDKEERGKKGAALTTFVSIAGSFLVLKPNKIRSGGISRRIIGQDRDIAKQNIKELRIPEGMSLILRTAGVARSFEELEWDLKNQLAIWEAIKTVVVKKPSPFLVYRESNAVIRALRDFLTNEINEIVVDNKSVHNEAKDFIEQFMPKNKNKLKSYNDDVPLFTRYQIESQIESAFAHTVDLPSGGSIVLDHTEALFSIDINSSRATKGEDIEDTALQTNLEAADEIGRQLRLRDLGGLIVIDFIDMSIIKNQRAVEARIRGAVKEDRARIQVGKISRFGLLEMSRQRLRPSLDEFNQLRCPRCNGIGFIRNVESVALVILRIIEEESRKEKTAKVIAQLPVEVATYLLNEKRHWVQSLEKRNSTQVVLIADSQLQTPHYNIRRIREDQIDVTENSGKSYTLKENLDEQIIPEVIQNKKEIEVAAVGSLAFTSPPPEGKTDGLFEKIKNLFGSDEENKIVSNKNKKNIQKKKPYRRNTKSRYNQKKEGLRKSHSQKHIAKKQKKSSKDSVQTKENSNEIKATKTKQNDKKFKKTKDTINQSKENKSLKEKDISVPVNNATDNKKNPNLKTNKKVSNSKENKETQKRLLPWKPELEKNANSTEIGSTNTKNTSKKRSNKLIDK